MSRLRVLLVDDDPEFLEQFCCMAEDLFEIATARSSQDALAKLANSSPDAVLLDVDLGQEDDGVDLLSRIRTEDPDLPVVMVSGDEHPETVVRAMKAGAMDYVSKRPNLQMLQLKVQRALDHSAWRAHARELQSESLGKLVGTSPAMAQLRDEIRTVGPTSVRVLIQGESGTGKELVAAALHEHSPRRNERFIPVNGAVGSDELFDSEFFGHEKGAFTGATARRRGRFELASGGTLFIDEIGRMPQARQAKLLRVIESGTFEPVGGGREVSTSVRLVAASNEDLAQKIEQGGFLGDLYYRVSEYVIRVPPLRERLSDLPDLVMVLLERFFQREKIPAIPCERDALDRLADHSWPGNIRELDNVLKRAALTSHGAPLTASLIDSLLTGAANQGCHAGGVSAAASTEPVGAGLLGPDSRIRDFLDGEYAEARGLLTEALERMFIERELRRQAGNISRTARRLGMHRATLHRKLEEYGIENLLR